MFPAATLSLCDPGLADTPFAVLQSKGFLDSGLFGVVNII
jgi:hypothetical protein